MTPLLRWMVIAAVTIGHFGLMLALYNRINGFGWPRRVIKSIVKVMFAYTIIFPVVIAFSLGGVIATWATGDGALPIPLAVYGWVCLAAWIVLGIPWLWWRPIFGREWIQVKRQQETIPVQSVVSNQLAISRKCRWERHLPLNQLFELSIDQIELPVVGLPESLDGYRIAHLSDIHLTGDIHPDFAAYAVQRATQWQPDLMAVTGDIIDSRRCIDWLPQIFAPASAVDGCYFVLGNHDRRIVDPEATRAAMDRAGWTDLGSRVMARSLAGVPSLLVGNEYPWFERPGEPEWQSARDQSGNREAEFRLLLSHSPDQFGWARRHHVTLMLAGHTHGGQGRLPLAGPLLSPSFHGSRYASGDFYRSPTTMHVSRGLAGTHLVRFRCPPELSLLTLRKR